MDADVDGEQPVLWERVDDHAVVTLNRPGRLNAITLPLAVELRERLLALDADDGVRAIVLTGAGRGFCAGADISGESGDVGDAGNAVRDYYNPLVETMLSMRAPIVAAVNGVAAGAGFSLALAADIRVVSTAASFTAAFVKIGFVPDSGATWLLPRIVGVARAREIALLGRSVSAQQALDWGIANEVVAPADLSGRAGEIARELAALPASVGQIRQLLRDPFSVDLATQLEAEASAQSIAQRHPHHAEAVRAFQEKRTAKLY